MGEEDERTLVHLLTDQMEFADVVILNKVSRCNRGANGSMRRARSSAV